MRSIGRNEAIFTAIEELGSKNIIIACTNLCVLDPQWLETITSPIRRGAADLVGGFWLIPTRNPSESAMALLTQWTKPEEVVFPSALSMAFTVQVWDSIGGFPEELDTSEDTEFVHRLRQSGLGFKEVFTKDAVVYWRPKTLTIDDAAKTYYQFAVTDAKAKLMSRQYAATFMAYALPLFVTVVIPWLGVLMLFGWFGFRIRKVLRNRWLLSKIPYTIYAAFSIDFARMMGYMRGRGQR